MDLELCKVSKISLKPGQREYLQQQQQGSFAVAKNMSVISLEHKPNNVNNVHDHVNTYNNYIQFVLGQIITCLQSLFQLISQRP